MGFFIGLLVGIAVGVAAVVFLIAGAGALAVGAGLNW